MPLIPVVGINYKFQPILVSDVADAIIKAIEFKDNHGKIYEIGGPQVISFGDMVKSIMRTLNKKRFVVEMPMPIAKIQSTLMSMLPIPPILTGDQCKILSEEDNDDLSRLSEDTIWIVDPLDGTKEFIKKTT